MAGYGSDDGFATWLAANGYDAPEGVTAAVLRQRASDYIDAQYGRRFTGSPSGGFDQERAWPRRDAWTAAGEAIPDTSIPKAIEQASYAAAYFEGTSPGGLSVAVVGASQIKREKTDVLETEYFAGSGDALADATPVFSAVEGLLAPFLIPTTRPAALVV